MGISVLAEPAIGSPSAFFGKSARERFSEATESGSSSYILISSRITLRSRANSASGIAALAYMSAMMSMAVSRYSHGIDA